MTAKGPGLDFVLSKPSSVKMKSSKPVSQIPSAPSSTKQNDIEIKVRQCPTFLTVKQAEVSNPIETHPQLARKDERVNCFSNAFIDPVSLLALSASVMEPMLKQEQKIPVEVESLLSLQKHSFQAQQKHTAFTLPPLPSAKPLPVSSFPVSLPATPGPVHYTKSSVNDLLTNESSQYLLPDWFIQEKERVLGKVEQTNK